jgi:hypothetical protein
MTVHTRVDMPQASFDAAERINLVAGHCPLGASDELIAYVSPFVQERSMPFTCRQIVLAIWRKEFLDGKCEDDITPDTSIRRGLDAMRKAKLIEKVSDGPRGQLWRVIQAESQGTQCKAN